MSEIVHASAVRFDSLSSTEDGYTLLSINGKVCKSDKLLSEIVQSAVDSEHFATEEWVNDQGFLKEHQSLDGYAKESWVSANYYNVDEINDFLDEKYYTSAFENVSGTFLTAHQNLDDYATQDWVNNQGFLKEHQDLSDYALSADVETELALKEDKIFVAVYNNNEKTSFAEIKEAYDSGKKIFLKLDNFNENNPGVGWTPYKYIVPLNDFYTTPGGYSPPGVPQYWFQFNFLNDGIPHKIIVVKVTDLDNWSTDTIPTNPDLSDYATKTYVNEEVGKVGSYVTATLVNNEPDVQNPSNKKIYLTKDDTVTGTDLYKEWIYTESSAWDCIGDTSMDLSNYYTKSETSGKTELTNAFNKKMNLFQIGTDLMLWEGKLGVHTNGKILNSNYAFVEGYDTSADGAYTHAEGQCTLARDNNSHAEGSHTSAIGQTTHAEGSYTLADGSCSHAEGTSTYAHGHDSHAEGGFTTANNFYAHAEGEYSIANATASHAEGYYTSAIGWCSHAEGNSTLASGSESHTEGSETSALGFASHAEGWYTIANDICMHVQGKYNKTFADAVFVIGNGTEDNDVVTRSDAFIVDWNGVASAVNLKTSAGQVMTEPTLAAGKQYSYTTTGWHEFTLPEVPTISAENGITATTGTGADAGKIIVGIDTTNYKLLTIADYNNLVTISGIVAANSGRWVVTPAN